jgi:hypothetical protein
VDRSNLIDSCSPVEERVIGSRGTVSPRYVQCLAFRIFMAFAEKEQRILKLFTKLFNPDAKMNLTTFAPMITTIQSIDYERIE